MSTPEQNQETVEPAYISRFKNTMTGSWGILERAQKVIPGGISHFPRWHDPYPLYCARARGSRMWDADGNEYIDLWMAHYDALLGHSPEPVVNALREILTDGLHVGIPMEYEVKLATMITELMPCAEMVRFCCSGTEADMYAIRLARGFTKRNVVLKIKGGFHGAGTDLSVDVFIPSFQGREGIGLVPNLDQYTRSMAFNDIDTTYQAIQEAGDDLAAVILEPALGAFMLPAEKEYLVFLREETKKAGALLIFDEIITGFRISLGSAQEYFGVTPDLSTMGKVMGGGMPIGAIGGRADILEISSVQRRVPQREKIFIGGGTYSANPLSMVAGITTLGILKERKDEIYPIINDRNQRLCEGIQQAFDAVDIPVHITRIGSLMAVHFIKEKGLPIKNAVDVAEHTLTAEKEEFGARMRNRGIYLLHGSALSIEHSDADVGTVIATAAECAKEMAEAR
jgi:glutamate-1-semialdehyde 2,1-aminomutase